MGYAMVKPRDDQPKALSKKPADASTALAQLQQKSAVDPWLAATEAKRRTADARMAVLGIAAQWVNDGASVNASAETLLDQMSTRPTAAQQVAMDTLGGLPSLPTLKRWLADFKKHGKVGLLPKHTGRQRVDYGWEARAVALFNLPSKPGYADVTFCLQREGYDDATVSRVETYLKTMPATLGKTSAARVGKKLHQLTKQNYVERHTDDLNVGDCYAADGHTIDCYLAHPETGNPFRAELTVFLDLKSRAIAGWWISESESSHTTLFALSNALTTHNHVPLFVYVDVGSGYKSKLMTDEVVGFYSKFDIEPIFALPGNPHGKGWIERFFRTIRNRHDKFFADGTVYCGDDAAPETNRRMSVEVRSGKRTLPSLAEYVDSLKVFFAQYMQTPMPVALVGKTPAQMWAELKPVILAMPAEAVARPSVTRTARRQSVTLDGRRYFALSLALYEGKEVRVEYDLHDDAHVWISTLDGRHIGTAQITERKGVISTSRIEDQRAKRLAGQIKRLEKHADEKRERATPVLDLDALADKLELGNDTVQALPAPNAGNLLDPLRPRREPVKQVTKTGSKTQQRIIDIDIY